VRASIALTATILAAAGCDREGEGRFDGLDDGSDPTTPQTTLDTGSPSTTTTVNTHTTGGAEQCVVLFGGNDRVRGPDEGLPVRDEPRTLQAWVRTSSLDEQVAVSHGRPSPGQGFQLGTVDGQPMARSGAGGTVVTGDVELADDRWHHLAASFDGRLVVLMVDGAVVGDGELDTATLQGDVVAGNTPTGDLSKPWRGWLDDVRVFRGARPTAEVEADLDGDGESYRNLVLWWDFEVDEGSGAGLVVDDLTGLGHDGVAAGAPLFVPCR
jgi:hypothetical protein